jgi:hypothetical protein
MIANGWRRFIFANTSAKKTTAFLQVFAAKLNVPFVMKPTQALTAVFAERPMIFAFCFGALVRLMREHHVCDGGVYSSLASTIEAVLALLMINAPFFGAASLVALVGWLILMQLDVMFPPFHRRREGDYHSLRNVALLFAVPAAFVAAPASVATLGDRSWTRAGVLLLFRATMSMTTGTEGITLMSSPHSPHQSLSRTLPVALWPTPIHTLIMWLARLFACTLITLALVTSSSATEQQTTDWHGLLFLGTGVSLLVITLASCPLRLMWSDDKRLLHTVWLFTLLPLGHVHLSTDEWQSWTSVAVLASLLTASSLADLQCLWRKKHGWRHMAQASMLVLGWSIRIAGSTDAVASAGDLTIDEAEALQDYFVFMVGYMAVAMSVAESLDSC